MGRARTFVDAYKDPHVLRDRPFDGTIYGHSTETHPLNGPVLSRPGWQGAFQGSSIDRAPSIGNDTLIVRQRDQKWRRPYSPPVATGPGNINWHDSGPTADLPTFRFNRNYRPIVGGSHSDMWGMHTNIPSGARSGYKQKGKTRMVPGRQNRLTVQRYRGQSYSSTTQMQT